jgi:hypothetical protein
MCELSWTSRCALSRALHEELRMFVEADSAVMIECCGNAAAALIHDLGGMEAAW